MAPAGSFLRNGNYLPFAPFFGFFASFLCDIPFAIELITLMDNFSSFYFIISVKTKAVEKSNGVDRSKDKIYGVVREKDLFIKELSLFHSSKGGRDENRRSKRS